MWSLAVFVLTNIVVVYSRDLNAILKERQTLFERELDMMVGNSIKLSNSELNANETIMKFKVEEIDDGFVNPKEFNLSKHFFEYKDIVKETKLFKILKKMPKGALLHAHDTGLLSPDYLVDVTYWDNLWVCFDDDDIDTTFRFSKTIPNNSDYPCAYKWELMKEARESSNNSEDFDANIRTLFTLVIDNPNEVYTDINTVWTKFQGYFTIAAGLFNYKPLWEQYFYDTLLALREDNVMYLEIRSVLPALYDLKGNTYSPLDTARIYKNVTEKFTKDYPDFFGAKLIYAPMKQVDSETMKKYIEIAKEIQAEMPDFLAGFDLVGQEDLGRPLIEFLPQLADVGKDMDLYLHAGETNWYGTSSDENLFDAIVLGTKRIGHGYALTKHPVLMKEVKKKGIALEVNVISNNVLKLVEDIRNHPLATFLSTDMPVVIASDDSGIWESEPLTHDFYVSFVGVASLHADLRLLKQLVLNSLYYSSYHEIDKIVYEFEIRWTKFINWVVKTKW